MCTAGPRATAVEDEGVSLPGVLVSAQHAVVLFLDRHRAAHGGYLSAHVIVTCQVHIIKLRTHAVRMKSLQAAERPADLAPIRSNC